MAVTPKNYSTLTDAQRRKLPSYMHPFMDALSSRLLLIHRLMDGPQAMWDGVKDYIRKWTDEDPKVYEIRSTCEPCFGGLKRTVTAGSGLLWNRAPAFDPGTGDPRRMEFFRSNIDGKGSSLTVFGAQISTEALATGLAVVLVDFPRAPRNEDGTRRSISLEEEDRLGLRPRASWYTRASIRSWLDTNIDGVDTLSQIVFREVHEAVSEGEYGAEEQERFRVLWLSREADENGVFSWKANWRIEEEVLTDGAITVNVLERGQFINRNGETASRLPLAMIPGTMTQTPLRGDIPLEHSAFANLSHWRYSTNLTFGREVAAIEQAVVIGDLQDEGSNIPGQPTGPHPGMEQPIFAQKATLKLGWLVAVYLKERGDFKYVAPSGTGLEQLAKGVAEKLQELDQQGLGFILPRREVQSTATADRIDAFAQLSGLASAGVAISDGLTDMWRWFGWYEGLNDVQQCASVRVASVFEGDRLTAQDLTALSVLAKTGFPKMAILEKLKDSGWLREDADLAQLKIDWEDEVEATAEADAERNARFTAAGKDPALTTDPNAAADTLDDEAPTA